jgi:CheY-like chemotaxis protein
MESVSIREDSTKDLGCKESGKERKPWHKQRPEVTLLDLRMPVLDGVGVINEVRQGRDVR